MRTEPSWRIPAGILALVCVLFVYGGLVATYLAPLMREWPALLQLPVYLVLGIVWLWLLPVRRFLKWMETGTWG
jgi:membrane protein YdbS with pleckstrin-like domain